MNDFLYTSHYETLQSNLYLLATDFASLKVLLDGYSDEGIYQECLESIREPMIEFTSMICSGKLSLDAIAKIFDCYFLMEELARYPYATNNAEAFKNNEHWNRVRLLAKEAADAMDAVI